MRLFSRARLWIVLLSGLLLLACQRDFTLPGGGGPSLCGNDTVNVDEECEDGNLSINDGCPSGPLGTCTDAVCGDGFAWVEGYGANEECDDGNDAPDDGCYRCQLEDHWLCAVDARNSPCWCGPGYQDRDEDGTCLPSCTNIELPPLTAHQLCDDSTGTVAYRCEADATLEPLDGLCELVACSPACGLHQACVEAGGSASCACHDYWIGAGCDTCRVLVDPAAACTNCDGLSWSTALPTLQQGIDLAANRAEGYAEHCEVWVKAGHYWVHEGAPQDTIQLEPWVALYGGFAGNEQTRAERDWRANRTILDGHAGPDSPEQAWHVVVAASNSIVDGFVVTGGKAAGRHGDGGQVLDDDGGAFLIDQVENVRVANCAIVSNSARTEGGAVRVQTSSVVFENCSFVANSTWNDVQFNRGGAIHSNWSATELRHCVLAGNAGDGHLVGLWNAAFPDANLVSNSLAVGNTSHITFDNLYSPTRYFATTVANNTPAKFGAIMHNSYTTVRTVNCLFAAHGPGLGEDSDFWHNGAGTEMTYSIFEGFDCGGQGPKCITDLTVVDAAPGFLAVSGSATGTWDSVAWDPLTVETTLTDSAAGWTAGERAGLFVQADTATVQQFPILENTASTLVVLGDLRPFVQAGAPYQLFDYRLDLTSAAVDAGTNLSGEGITDDLLGAPRNICHTGSAPECYDAGAHELQ